MANIKSAEKRIHIAERKRLRNKTRLSRLRTAIKKFGAAGGTTKTGALPSTHSEIDRALAKGVIHRNAAARYKSRLAKSAAAK
jgi:small subunit ribosomal protein S20